ncbi:MAG: fibrillarin [Candidatus Altiarchaeales archaeon ex4484_2]|nr:MAG: fibrillarin [Candidatus Altiarchaeales archaeon ex4484_2]
MAVKELFPGVYGFRRNIASLNNTPGFRVYDEKLIKKKGKEYRLWDPYRSKLSAAVLKGLKSFPFREDSNVLYLGASSGTTPSHLSDVCFRGFVYCVELSRRMMRELMPVTMKKKNMIPILADANRPQEYMHAISSVDVIYQDVAQKNQSEILLKNAEYFRPEHALLLIKARSINAVESPKKVFRKEINQLKNDFTVLETIDLRPYDKDHVLVNLKRK